LESSKARVTADKKEHKSSPNICQKYLVYPQDFWANILWTDATKVELFGKCVSRYIWLKTNTALHKKNIIPTIKHGLQTSGPARLAISDGTMNSALYQKILKATVRPSVCDLKLKHTWVIQQDNDPKHTSKSTSEWLKNN